MVDLFVSRMNRQPTSFFSRRPDPEVLVTDAFLQQWKGKLCYAFSPFQMILKVAAQVRRQEAELIVVTPTWRNQVWFPVLLQMA